MAVAAADSSGIFLIALGLLVMLLDGLWRKDSERAGLSDASVFDWIPADSGGYYGPEPRVQAVARWRKWPGTNAFKHNAIGQ